MTPALILAIAQAMGIALPAIVSVVNTFVIKTNDGREISLIIQDNKAIAQSTIDEANAWLAAHPKP